MSQIMLANRFWARNCYKIVNQIPAQADGKDANLLMHCNKTQLIPQPHDSRSRNLKHVHVCRRTQSWFRNDYKLHLQQVTEMKFPLKRILKEADKSKGERLFAYLFTFHFFIYLFIFEIFYTYYCLLWLYFLR